MKLVREILYEKFTDESDPINDMGIGLKHLIEKWLNNFNILNYTINNDLTIDLKNDLYLRNCSIKEFPNYIQFNNVAGSVSLADIGLISLRGCPRKIGGFFSCGYNLITSFTGGPEEILISSTYSRGNSGYGYAASNLKKLVSIEGLAKTINGNLWMIDNRNFFTEEEIRKISNIKGEVIL